MDNEFILFYVMEGQFSMKCIGVVWFMAWQGMVFGIKVIFSQGGLLCFCFWAGEGCF